MALAGQVYYEGMKDADEWPEQHWAEDAAKFLGTEEDRV